MDADDRNSADLLRTRLAPILERAHRMPFFRLVSLLERSTDDAVRIGGDGPPSAEALRFRHDPSLAFAAGDVRAARVRQIPRDPDNPLGEKRALVEIATTFLGLTGSVSPMPLYIAEEISLEDSEVGVRRDFLDVFHHRLISILYRSVSRYSPAREHRARGDDPWVRRMLSLSGMDPDTFVPKSAIPPSKLLRLAPLVARRGRGARALQRALNIVLEDHLGPDASVSIVELAGGWMSIFDNQRCALGKTNSILGRDALIGTKTFDRGGSFKIEIGPLGSEGREAFSEDGAGLMALRDCVSLMVPQPLDYDVELEFAPHATIPFHLSSKRPGRLGENTRLGSIGVGETVRLRKVGRRNLPAETPPKSDASLARREEPGP